jgi:hypothetical protein
MAYSIATRRSGVQILAGATDFFLLQNIHTSSEGQPVSYSRGTVILFLENYRGVKLTTNFH